MKIQPFTLVNYADANERILGFAEQFDDDTYLVLSWHAAFPLLLTPDLLYQIWANFVREAPWTAVARILLSPLCREVGFELYAIDPGVRNLLLQELRTEFGDQRLEDLAEFLQLYIEQRLVGDDAITRDFREMQEWTVLTYTRPGEMAQKLAEQLQSAIEKKQVAAIARLTSLADWLADPLVEWGFVPLLLHSRAIGSFVRGDSLSAYLQWGQLRQAGKTTVEVGRVRFDISRFPYLSEFWFETVRVNPKGEEIERQRCQAFFFEEELGNGVSLEMVYIPGGEFLMGSPDGEKGEYDDEKPQHRVKVQPFFMSKYPITQEQWEVIAGKQPKKQMDLNLDPSEFKGKKRPVEKVNWYEIIEWCARLSAKTGKPYRLPSEAQWEYGCRGGTETPFYFGETLTEELANYDASETYAEEPKGKWRRETTEVGIFPPNAFGLYDLHGNVWEWCLDPWHNNYKGGPSDEQVWDDNNNENHYQNLTDDEFLVNILNDKKSRLVRGGSWYNSPRSCRAAYRNLLSPDDREDINDNLGFRVVCPLVACTPDCQNG